MMRADLALVVIAIVAAVAAPWWLPWDSAAQDLAHRLQGSMLQHLFGLDELGRDILARV